MEKLQLFKRKESRRSFLHNATRGLTALSIANLLKSSSTAQNQTRLRATSGTSSERTTIAFAIHGGAGVIERHEMSAAEEKAYRAALEEALAAGYNALKNHRSGLDAVEAAIKILEDSPLFNAGRGAVFTNAGTNELDASIMDGKTLKAGAVSTLKHIKNPISLARLVMEQSPHVMMVGDGAETFAKQHGVKLVPQEYFYTEKRWKDWQRVKREEEDEQARPQRHRQHAARAAGNHLGTVGAVALDEAGNLAAGTSTGGLTNKKFGRVGDSPIIGAGTYANNQTCAVSATGDGEYFIRAVVAHDISAMLEYKNVSLNQAALAVIEKVGKLGGTGGVIVMDKTGRIAMPFNTEGMYRGYVGADGKLTVKIYRD
jgi:beta-aspartyl-peptidase (threonine type)